MPLKICSTFFNILYTSIKLRLIPLSLNSIFKLNSALCKSFVVTSFTTDV